MTDRSPLVLQLMLELDLFALVAEAKIIMRMIRGFNTARSSFR